MNDLIPAPPHDHAVPSTSHDLAVAAGEDVETKRNEMERFHTRYAEYLCDRQLRAIELILAGEREGKVAEAVGVGRTTLWRWRNDCHFRRALAAGRDQVYGAALDRIRVLVPHAVDRLQDQLEEGDVHAPYRLLRLARVEHAEPNDDDGIRSYDYDPRDFPDEAS